VARQREPRPGWSRSLGEGDPLLLAARHLVREVVAAVGKTDQFERSRGALAPLSRADIAYSSGNSTFMLAVVRESG